MEKSIAFSVRELHHRNIMPISDPIACLNTQSDVDPTNPDLIAMSKLNEAASVKQDLRKTLKRLVWSVKWLRICVKVTVMVLTKLLNLTTFSCQPRYDSRLDRNTVCYTDKHGFL